MGPNKKKPAKPALSVGGSCSLRVCAALGSDGFYQCVNVFLREDLTGCEYRGRGGIAADG